MNKKIALTLVLAATTQLATAEGNGSIAPVISTLGAGVEYKYPVTDEIAVGVGAYAGNFSHTEKGDNVTYNSDLKLRHVAVTGSYYPWDNGFHVAGGIVVNDSRLEAHANAKEGKSFNIDGKTYTTEEVGSVDAKVDLRRVAPYVGVGWDNGNKGAEGWSIAASAGVMFNGDPDLSLAASKCDLNTAEACAELDRRIENERADFENNLNALKVYPVLSVGAEYSF